MKTISIINLKGGVGKTVSAINIAHVLSAVHGKQVLLIDNDKQGNCSKFFGLHSYSRPSIADLLTLRNESIDSVIQHSGYNGLHIIPANMNLLGANSSLLIDTRRSRDYRLKKVLEQIAPHYDFCIIDNAPDINISVINALMAADDVLVPIKIDKFAFDGLQELVEQIEDVQESNPILKLAGCFFTMYQRNNVNQQGDEWLRTQDRYPVFCTRIRSTVKVTEMTYSGRPLLDYSKNSTAAQDYVRLVAEYLDKAGEKSDD